MFCTQRYKVWHWRGCSAVAILMGVISRVVFKLLLLNLAGRLLLAKEKSSTPGSVTGERNFSTSCFSYLPMEIISRTVQFAWLGMTTSHPENSSIAAGAQRMLPGTQLPVTAAAAQLLKTPASSRT